MLTKRLLFTVAVLLVVLGIAPALSASSRASRLGPEIQLSLTGDAERYLPAVAYNYVHGEYLVVWHNTWPGGHRDVYARRVSDRGELKTWFAVSAGDHDRCQPAVAYNAANDEYLVVWMYNASGDGSTYDIWGRIVAWNGSYMGPEFEIISFPNRTFDGPSVAWNGWRNEYLVVWNAYDATTHLPTDVCDMRVSAAGDLLTSEFIALADSPHQADVVYNIAMDEYFVVFVVVHTQATTGNDIYGVRVRGLDGAPVDPPGLIPIATYQVEKDQNAPAVATNEQDRYMVVWEHEWSGADHDIYGREFNALGSPVGSDFSIWSGTEDDTAPDIAANGANNEWLAVWQQALGGGAGYAVKGYRWGPTVNTYFFDVANYVFWENQRPAVAADIPGYLIVYEGDSSMTDRHIYGRMWWPEAVYLPLVLRNY